MATLSWPPSPCVEDEEIALSREHGSDSSDSDSAHGKPPAVSRGSVDQYPLIIDVNAKEDNSQQTGISRKKQDEILAKRKESATPVQSPETHNVRDDRRFNPVHSNSPASLDVPLGQARPRSKSTTRVDGDETPRGRPQVHRLQTDFGGDLHAMASGQRRPPSPYSYRPPATVHQATTSDKPKASFLSPETAAAPRTAEGHNRRSRSARPERQTTAIESSDSDQKSSRRNHRSRSRHTRPSDPKQPVSGGEEHFSERRSDRRDSYRTSRRSPPRLHHTEKSHRSAHGNITPPQTPRLPRESPYTSVVEEPDRHRRRDKSREPERRNSRESPYTSGAEDSSRRWDRDRDDRAHGVPSRRGSTRRTEKPHLDLSDDSQNGRFDSNAPYGGRTPKAVEDYLQKAFDENKTRRLKQSSQYSVHLSPLSSPPTSPPRTPRGERKSRDYFEINAPASPAKQRSRQTSLENPIKPLTSLLGAAMFGASQKPPSNPSRSSTASLETPSSGPLGSGPSAQRSRKPSPVQEDPKPVNSRPGSRAGSLTATEELQAQRSSTMPAHQDRPVSRAGSTASWEDVAHNHRASTFPMREERPSSRNGTYMPTGPEHPPMAQRAASYSSYDQQRTRPSSRRTYSTNGSTTVMPASSYHSHLGPSHLSKLAYVAVTPAEAAAMPPAQPATSEQRTLSFPSCPQPYPVTGYHNWYTIRGTQDFDVCSSCASVLGRSTYRDYCVPSWKPDTVAVTCALSRPWIRIAIARALKEGSANVTLLQNLNMLPENVLPCPGKQSDVRKWYHITDPTTNSPIANFDVCTACVRSMELIYPELCRDKLFDRPSEKLSQERVCNLNTGSKHFYTIFKELEKLASYCRKKDLRPKDVTEFGTFVRQKTRFRECARDAMLATTLWHYIPGIPEFTVCEECYNEVVWPLRNMPIAKDVIPTLQKVSLQRPDHYVAGISCQLYSDRMRAIFKNFCSRNDFEGFRQNAIMRYNVEHKLQEKHRALQQDMSAGIDRRKEMEKNSALWKTYE